MNQSPLGALRLKLDDWRVRLHFKRVERILRAQDVSHLPPTLQRARERHLDQLHAYAARGVFPRNYERPGCAPCFIDRDGRACAVAHLVIASGSAETAYNIAAVANYAYVPQMTFPELDEWAAQAGLSREELALIQPGYFMTFSGPLVSFAIAAWVIGLATAAINAVQIARRRDGIVAPVIGLVIAIVLMLVGILCLWGLIDAYSIVATADGFQPVTLSDVRDLVLGALISLGIALLAGGLGFYRMRAFMDAESRNRQQIIGNADSLSQQITDSQTDVEIGQPNPQK